MEMLCIYLFLIGVLSAYSIRRNINIAGFPRIVSSNKQLEIASPFIGSQLLNNKIKIPVEKSEDLAKLKKFLHGTLPMNAYIANTTIYCNGVPISEMPVDFSVDDFFNCACWFYNPSAVNKTLSVKQLIDSYASLLVMQKQLLNEECLNMNESCNLMSNNYEVLMRSFYNQYAVQIEQAKLLESNPVIEVLDNAFITQNRLNAVSNILIRYFDIVSLSEMQSLLYYSALLSVFAYYGAPSEIAKNILLAGAISIWAIPFRPIGYGVKICKYTILQAFAAVPVVSSLLAAPYKALTDYFGEIKKNMFDRKNGTKKLPVTSAFRKSRRNYF